MILLTETNIIVDRETFIDIISVMVEDNKDNLLKMRELKFYTDGNLINVSRETLDIEKILSQIE